MLRRAVPSSPPTIRARTRHVVVSSSTTTSPPSVLVRAAIRDALYAPESGYFSGGREIIHAPLAPVDYTSLLGEAEYRSVCARLYGERPHAWLTPATLFAPHYSHALARWLVRAAMSARARGGGGVGGASAPLVVYEVGGGTGTNAAAVCDWVAAHAPQLYRRLQYTVLEISPALRERQLRALAPHAGVATSVLGDATCLPPALADARPCFVLALEVLDNLPHDKVVARAVAAAAREDGGGHSAGEVDGGAWQQVEVVCEAAAVGGAGEGRSGGGGSDMLAGAAGAPSRPPLAVYREVLRPLRDPVIADTLRYFAACPGAAATGETAAAVAGREAASEAAVAAAAAAAAPSLLMRAGRRAVSAVLQRATGARLREGYAAGVPLVPRLRAARYLPTGCAQMLRSLGAAFPRHTLLLADFDELPPPSVDVARAAAEDHPVRAYHPAACAPLVASKRATAGGGSGGAGGGGGGVASVTVDHATYLSPRRGIADIFFATDFSALSAMVGDVARERAAATGCPPPPPPCVLKSREFMARHADVGRTATMSGFNPLLEDYVNTSICISTTE